MSHKEFNWDAFNAALQKSTNICSGARKDIEHAIAAGKGVRKPKRGEVWRYACNDFRLITGGGGAVSLDIRASDYTRAEVEEFCSTGEWSFVAYSLQDYLAHGGKL